MATEEPKLCVQCTKCFIVSGRYMCHHKETFRASLITGEMVEDQPPTSCSIERTQVMDNYCGSDAKWFVRRQPEPPRPPGWFRRLCRWVNTKGEPT